MYKPLLIDIKLTLGKLLMLLRKSAVSPSFNGSGLFISMLEILNLFRLAGQTLVLLMRKMDRLVFEEKLSFTLLLLGRLN